MLPTRPLAYLALFLAASIPSRAAMVWQANFNSYDTSGGAVNVTVNSTGNDDTLSGTSSTTGVGYSFAAQVADSSSLTNPLSGNALRLSFTNSSGSNVSSSLMTIFQGAQVSLTGNGIYILSADMERSSSSGISGARSWGAVGDSATTGSNNTTTVGVGTTPWRFTFVINQTGSAITLPGSLGSLANNSGAGYYYDGSAYSGLTTTSITSANVSGFATGSFRSNSLTSGQTVTVWYDNMGLWNSASDTFNGTSVLSLAPGTVIPEPTVMGLCCAAFATVLVGQRRRARR